MRARESCRPSALPLKVGRKPKLTSNKVFEVVRGGSWGNCCSERRLEERRGKQGWVTEIDETELAKC